MDRKKMLDLQSASSQPQETKKKTLKNWFHMRKHVFKYLMRVIELLWTVIQIFQFFKDKFF